MDTGDFCDFRIKSFFVFAEFSNEDNSFSVLQHTIIGCIQRLKFGAVPILMEQFLHIVKMQRTILVLCR